MATRGLKPAGSNEGQAGVIVTLTVSLKAMGWVLDGSLTLYSSAGKSQLKIECPMPPSGAAPPPSEEPMSPRQRAYRICAGNGFVKTAVGVSLSEDSSRLGA